jgi:hypothetical protein
MKNTKLTVNIIELVPKEWTVEEVDDNLFKVYYINKGRGNSPKPIILPKEINISNKLIEGMSMYIGDGKLSKDLGHLEFTSKDFDLLNFMRNFFERILLQKVNRIRKRNNAYSFQLSSKILRIIFGTIVEKVLAVDYSLEPKLRKAFLRGIFAAEGSVNIQKKENYLAYLGIHLSYEKEKELANLVSSLLNLEGVSHKQFSRPNKGERYIQITGWENYFKANQMNLFSLSKRKTQQFQDHLNSRKLYFNINSDFLNIILKEQNKRQLAFEINEDYNALRRRIVKKSLGKEQMKKICALFSISKKEILPFVNTIKIWNSSPIKNRETINYVIDKYLPDKIKNHKTWLP